MSTYAPTTLFWILCHLINVSLCYYTIDNGKNLRIVSLWPNCQKGRVEFFNGSSWGSLTDCAQQFSSSNGKSICQTLGWDSEQEYWRGASKFDEELTINPLISYTQLTNCSTISTRDTCSDCSPVTNLNTCNASNTANIHALFDIYIYCDNYGLHKQSSTYNCTQSLDLESAAANNAQQYTSCHATVLASDGRLERSKKVIISVAGVAIFGSILCVIMFAAYSKYQDSQRLSRLNDREHESTTSKSAPSRAKKNMKASLASPIGALKSRNGGFCTVPQGVELPVLHGAHADYHESVDDTPLHSEEEEEDTAYIPPPQPMFVYATREVAMDDAVQKGLQDEDTEHNSGYDMEEIIPSVIYSAGNKSPSESYGLIRNQDDDEEDDNY